MKSGVGEVEESSVCEGSTGTIESWAGTWRIAERGFGFVDVLKLACVGEE